jgi:hypothetical protein
MDNLQLDITSQGRTALERAIQLIWDNCPGGFATHCDIVKLTHEVHYYGEPTSGHYTTTKVTTDGIPTMILYWHEASKGKELPYPFDRDHSIDFIWNWLQGTEFPPEPDIDGSCSKGWRVFNEAWGHVAGNHYAIVAIQPEWAMHGK